MDIALLVALLVGIVLGALVTWVVLKGRIELTVRDARANLEVEKATLAERAARLPAIEAALSERERTQEKLRLELGQLHALVAKLETQLVDAESASQEKITLVEESGKRLENSFKALAQQALSHNNQSFLQLATETLAKHQEGAKGDLEKRQQAIDALVKPLASALEKVDTKLQDIEKSRVGAYEKLTEQVSTLATSQTTLQKETTRLVDALRTPNVRGRWGEIQLRRVVELAGMVAHCDFEEQSSVGTDDGQLRPDLVVRLPGQKNIVVDAKAPLKAYLQAIEAPDEEQRRPLLEDHARLIRSHMSKLSGKAYWSQFQPTPEFVVMFLPGETFFSAAVHADPTLIEDCLAKRVVLASPTTFIAVLRAVAYGWQQEKLAESAQAISTLGRELYDRLRVFTEHLGKVGLHLGRAVDSYNDAARSCEARLTVTARKFKELGVAATDDLAETTLVDRAVVGTNPRAVPQNPELPLAKR